MNNLFRQRFTISSGALELIRTCTVLMRGKGLKVKSRVQRVTYVSILFKCVWIGRRPECKAARSGRDEGKSSDSDCVIEGR